MEVTIAGESECPVQRQYKLEFCPGWVADHLSPSDLGYGTSVLRGGGSGKRSTNPSDACRAVEEREGSVRYPALSHFLTPGHSPGHSTLPLLRPWPV